MDEFLAKSGVGRCQGLKEAAEVVAKVGFKMFLGVAANVANWSSDESEFSLILDENPLAEFVDLPKEYQSLFFSNILCGVIRGALEMVHMKVECRFLKDVLRGDDCTEMRVLFKEMLSEARPINDE